MEYTISITNKCNLHCAYCYERHLNTDYGHIDDERADRIIKFITDRNDAGRVYLFGGEPLLYKDLIKRFCTEIEAKEFVITTNGTLLDEEFITWCDECGKNIVINMSHDGKNCEGRGVDCSLLDGKLLTGRILLCSSSIRKKLFRNCMTMFVIFAVLALKTYQLRWMPLRLRQIRKVSLILCESSGISLHIFMTFPCMS